MLDKDKIEKLNDIKELCDIQDDYQKTHYLLRNQQWEKLRKHITNVIGKYPVEAQIYNFYHPYMPSTTEQNAINCMSFLKGLAKVKWGVDLIKYMSK